MHTLWSVLSLYVPLPQFRHSKKDGICVPGKMIGPTHPLPTSHPGSGHVCPAAPGAQSTAHTAATATAEVAPKARPRTWPPRHRIRRALPRPAENCPETAEKRPRENRGDPCTRRTRSAFAGNGPAFPRSPRRRPSEPSRAARRSRRGLPSFKQCSPPFPRGPGALRPDPCVPSPPKRRVDVPLQLQSNPSNRAPHLRSGAPGTPRRRRRCGAAS